MCEDIAGGSDMSAGGTFFFAKYGGPSSGSQLLGGGIIILCIVHGRWMSFVDHVDQAAPRAPWRWTTARPRKGTTRSRGRLGNGCPRGGEYEGLLVRLPSPENNRRCG